MDFLYYKDKKGEHRWKIVHQNGNIMADSGEGYKNKQDCIDGLHSVAKGINEACGVRMLADSKEKKLEFVFGELPIQQILKSKVGSEEVDESK